MKIGFTERGDAGIDLNWAQKLGSVDGAIIITKNANPRFANTLMSAHAANPGKLVLHLGCTGLGATPLEPHVPSPEKQLAYGRALVDAGFPLDHVVLRVDPIIPTEKPLARAAAVIDGARALGLLNESGPSARLRMSVYDEYRHVKARLAALNIAPVYGPDAFYATTQMFEDVLDMLDEHVPHSMTIATCAEPKLVEMAKHHSSNLVAQGCLSTEDLVLMGLDPAEAPSAKNGQNRFGCLCLACKRELLANKKRCPHKCAYCYWQGD